MNAIDLALQFGPFIVLSIPFVIGNYFLAEKSGRSGALYLILTIIPIVGYITTVYLFYRAVMLALDRAAPLSRVEHVFA